MRADDAALAPSESQKLIRMRPIASIPRLMTCLAISCILLLCSCVNGPWLDEVVVNTRAATPEELVRLLGPPAKIVRNQPLPYHGSNNQEYRYFVAYPSGDVQFRRWFFDDSKWLTTVYSHIPSQKHAHFKVIRPDDPAYREQVERLLAESPELRHR